MVVMQVKQTQKEMTKTERIDPNESSTTPMPWDSAIQHQRGKGKEKKENSDE